MTEDHQDTIVEGLLNDFGVKTQTFPNHHLNININTFKLDNEKRRNRAINFDEYAMSINLLTDVLDTTIIDRNNVNKLKHSGAHFFSSTDENEYMVLAIDIDEFDGDSLNMETLKQVIKLIHPNAIYSIAEGNKNSKNPIEDLKRPSYLVSVYNVMGTVKEFNSLFNQYLKHAVNIKNINMDFKIDGSIYTANHLIRLPYSIVDTKPYHKNIITGKIEDFDFTNTTDKLVFSLDEFIEKYSLQHISISNKKHLIETVDKRDNEYINTLQRYEERYKLRGSTISIKDMFALTNIYYGFIHALSPLPPLLNLLIKFFNRHKQNGVIVHNDNCKGTDTNHKGVEYQKLSLFTVFTAINTLVQIYHDSTSFLTLSTKSANKILLNKLHAAIYDACTDNAKANFDARRKRYSINTTTGDFRVLFDAIVKLDFDILTSYFMTLKYFSNMNVDKKLIESLDKNEIGDIVEEWRNPKLKYDKFESTNYTIISYLKDATTYEFLARHLHALSHCIAYISNLRKFAIKMPPNSDNDGRDNRFVYKLMNIDDIEKEFKEIIKVNYTKDELQYMIDADSDENKLQPWYSRTYQTTIGKILKSSQDQIMSYFAVYDNVETFGYKPTDYEIKEPLYYNTHSSKQKNECNDEVIDENDINKKLLKCKEYLGTVVDESNTLLSTRKLCMFVPPVDTGYNKDLATIWFTAMLGCIEPNYHNAFFDFIYAIRYRILSRLLQIPAKIYVNYGKGGDGKSFMCESISNILGSFAQTTSAKQTADQFNKWEFSKGFIYIEEAENINEREFRTYIKNITTVSASARGMNEELDIKPRLAIRAMNTNSPTLCDLVYGDKAVVDRLVIIKFKENNAINEENWHAVHTLFKFGSFEPNTKTKNGPYSLFRYIIDDDGFVANEGKDYKGFDLSRYDGEEKYEFIKNAKQYKYNLLDEKMRDVIDKFEDQVMRYSVNHKYNYIDQQHLKSYLKEKTNLRYTDNELNLWFAKRDEWHYSKRILDDDGGYITGYRRNIKNSVDYNDDMLLIKELIDITEDQEDDDTPVIERNKNELLKERLKKDIINYVHSHQHERVKGNDTKLYISTADVKTYVKSIDTNDMFSVQDIREVMSNDGFEDVKIINIKNQRFQAYIKPKK